MPEDPARDQLRLYLSWVDALLRSMELALSSADPSNVWRFQGYKQFARKYTQILSEVAKGVDLPPILDVYNIDKMPGGGDTIAYEQEEVFKNVNANLAILKAFLENRIGVVEDKTQALRDFFAARLRSAIFKVPEKEREVQDAVEQLLIGRGLQKGTDYDRETGRVKVSIKEAIPDFVVLALGLSIEVKLTASLTRVKEVVDEINADIAAYSPKYRSLLFLVYDLGSIRDEVEFRTDLERLANVSVLVIKH